MYSERLHNHQISIEHLCDVVEQVIHIIDAAGKICSSCVSIWTKTHEDRFQHLLKSMPRRNKAALKARVQPGTSKVYLMKCLTNACQDSERLNGLLIDSECVVS